MKKKLKIALMSLVLIPCLLLLSACSASTSKYAEKLATASKTYFFNHGEQHWEDVSFTTTTESTKTYDESVEYIEGHSISKSFAVETESTETIEIDAYKLNESTLNSIRITTISKETMEGWKANEAKTGVEAFTKVTETTTVKTLVKEGEAFKYFYETKVRVDGVEDETLSKKSVYTFADEGTYNTFVRSVAKEINSKIVIPTFFASFNTQFALGEGNYYTSFGKFGAKYEMTQMDLDSTKDPLTNITEYGFEYYDIEFKNTLKKSGPVKAEYNFDTYSYGDPRSQSNINNEVESELKVNYDEISIVAPTGFAETDVTTTVPTVDVSKFLSL